MILLGLEDVLCHVEISTEEWFDEESEDMDIHILFKDGQLSGRTYTLSIPKEDLAIK